MPLKEKKVQDEGWKLLEERRNAQIAAQDQQAAVLQQHPEMAAMLGFKKGEK
jgi:hypothetical protein